MTTTGNGHFPPGQFPPVPLKTQLENYIYTYMYAHMHTYIHTHIDVCTHVMYIRIQYICSERGFTNFVLPPRDNRNFISRALFKALGLFNGLGPLYLGF